MSSEHPGVDAAEQAAAMLTSAGMARMPARVMMALVGSPDEGYTAAELGDRLGVSAAAVSGAVRYLVSMRLIQRLSRAGDRRDRYDLTDDAWSGMITANAPLYSALADAHRQHRRRQRRRTGLGREGARRRRLPEVPCRADAASRGGVAGRALLGRTVALPE